MRTELRLARPNEGWFAGGIIKPVKWEGVPFRLTLWDGTSEDVEPGDSVLVFLPGYPIARVVGVEKADP